MDPVQLRRILKNVADDHPTTNDAAKQEGARRNLNPCNKRAFYPCWLLLMFFKVIGLATFSMQGSADRDESTSSSHFRRSAFGVAYNIILTSGIIGVNYFSLPHRYYSDRTRRLSLSTVIEIAQGVIGSLAVSVIFLTHGFNQAVLVRVANRLLDAESDVRQFRSSTGCKRILIGVVICFAFNCLSIGATVLDYTSFDTAPIMWFIDVVPTFLSGWLLLQYVFVLRLIQGGFADVNRSMRGLPRTLFPERRQQETRETHRVLVSRSTMKELLQLESVHTRLHEILGDVMGFYSLPTLCAIGFIFLSLIYNGYFAFALLLQFERFDVWQLICTLWWIVFLIFPLLMLTARVDVISAEVNRSGNVW